MVAPGGKTGKGNLALAAETIGRIVDIARFAARDSAIVFKQRRRRLHFFIARVQSAVESPQSGSPLGHGGQGQHEF